MKPTYRKSWAGNLLMWSDLTLSPTFMVKRGQPKLKVLITRLLMILKVWNVKPTCRISWAVNLLMWSDLTLGASFKVKRWFTDFGELSFQWIQICIGSPMCGSSFCYYMLCRCVIYCVFGYILYLKKLQLKIITKSQYLKTSSRINFP